MSVCLTGITNTFKRTGSIVATTVTANLRHLGTCQKHFSPITAAQLDPTSKTIIVSGLLVTETEMKQICMVYFTQVDFEGQRKHEYPWIFLEDNCTCSRCFHSTSQSRLRKLTDLAPNNDIVSVNVENNGNAIHCIWKDGHTGHFTENWLLNRNFSRENIAKRLKSPRSDPKFMNASTELPTADFNVLNY